MTQGCGRDDDDAGEVYDDSRTSSDREEARALDGSMMVEAWVFVGESRLQVCGEDYRVVV